MHGKPSCRYLSYDDDDDADGYILQECNGEFADGRYFLRGDTQDCPVCVSCEERRLKAA